MTDDDLKWLKRVCVWWWSGLIVQRTQFSPLRTPLELEPHHRPITLGKVIHKIRVHNSASKAIKIFCCLIKLRCCFKGSNVSINRHLVYLVWLKIVLCLLNFPILITVNNLGDKMTFAWLRKWDDPAQCLYDNYTKKYTSNPPSILSCKIIYLAFSLNGMGKNNVWT